MKRSLLYILFFAVTICVNAQKVPVMQNWVARKVVSDSLVRAYGIDNCFVAMKIDDKIFARIKGKSWASNCTLNRDDLRYVRILHRNAEGKSQMGELIVDRQLSDDVIYIFRKLYDAGYRIQQMVLIDEYGADDERSMSANNTSCFNFRFVTGSHTQISYHGRGRAIDLNPLYNPYVRVSKSGKVTVSPSNGRKYAFDRNNSIPYFIDRNDLAYKLFRERGWRWGGNYRSLKDYQHFEK